MSAGSRPWRSCFRCWPRFTPPGVPRAPSLHRRCVMNDSANRTGPVLRVSGVAKTYAEGRMRTPVLRDVNFELERGKTLAIIGASGAGKSTLLHIVGGLDTLDSGTVEVDGRELSRLSDTERGRVRNRSLGFIYQFHHLLPEFTALENVTMPLLIGRVNKAEARRRSIDMLTRVGLAERLEHEPAELSEGERQRVAIAGALVTD